MGLPGSPGIGFVGDFQIYSEVKNISNYDPALDPFGSYQDTSVVFPSMAFVSPGDLTAILAASLTDSGSSVRYTVGPPGFPLWWNGTAWVVSNSTYAEANNSGDSMINAPSLLAYLAPGKQIQYTAYFPAGSARQSVSGAAILYTGKYYSIDNPTVFPNAVIIMEGLIDFVTTETLPGTSTIKYAFWVDGFKWVWWSGSAWVESDGTYSQANTAADIHANVSSFPTTQSWIKVRAFLHSEDEMTTPILSSLALSYTFAGSYSDVISTCMVWGYVYDEFDIPKEGVNVKVTLSLPIVQYKTVTQIVKKTQNAVTDSSGLWKILLVDTDNMITPGSFYIFTINGKVYNRKVPVADEAAFNTLPIV